MSCVAFIPARSGSKRIPNKNIRLLQGHPLIAYTIRAALDSKIFDKVYVITDSSHYQEVAVHYGALCPKLRPKNTATDSSPDIVWLRWCIENLIDCEKVSAVSILRPTSPFRTAETIYEAWDLFNKSSGYDSLRAVEKCSQHPGKMWTISNNCLLPLLPFSGSTAPWHSSPYCDLPEVYVQNASLEIAWLGSVLSSDTIAGTRIMPFLA